jgi:hypothetical protein
VNRLEDVLSKVRKEDDLREREVSSKSRRSLLGSGSESQSVFFLNFKKNVLEAAWAVGLGLFSILMAGWPFWLIGFTPSLAWPASRFTLPFMFGVGLVLGGVALLIPSQILRSLFLTLLVAFGAGKQFTYANAYSQDWSTQKELFWQLTWRAPGIQPDTAIIMNEGGLKFYADNSLSPVMNWVYASGKRGEDIDYVLLYPTTRLKSDALPKLEAGLPIFTDYLAGTFHGNTSQVLAIYFMPPACMRILDPEIDRVNRSIPEQSLMRFASRLTNYSLITEEQTSQMPLIYGPEPEHGWCFYFQKAELARQFGRWDEVASLADSALELDHQPADPVERFVFIEGYAHIGKWDQAIELSRLSFEESREFMGVPLCRLWERIEAATAFRPERSVVLSEVRTLFGCSP